MGEVADKKIGRADLSGNDINIFATGHDAASNSFLIDEMKDGATHDSTRSFRYAYMLY